MSIPLEDESDGILPLLEETSKEEEVVEEVQCSGDDMTRVDSDDVEGRVIGVVFAQWALSLAPSQC